MQQQMILAALIAALIVLIGFNKPEPTTEPLFGGTAPTETFDGSYANGNDMNGLNGGSGFAAAYAASGAGIYSITNSNPGEGSLSGYITRTNPGGGEPYISRQLSSALSDVSNIKFMIRRGGTHPNVNVYSFNLQPNAGALSADGYYGVSFDNSSNIYVAARGGSTVTLVAGASQDTWYYCVMQIDPVNYRARAACSTSAIVAEPTWSSWSTGNPGTFTSTSMGYMSFSVGGANNGTSEWQIDDIGPYSVPVVAPPEEDERPLFN